MADAVTLRPWGAGDAPLLERLLGDPAMMEHLGGVESPEKIAERQRRYAAPDSGCFVICTAAGEATGWVGFWERDGPGRPAYEVGWSVLPEFQGRGLAASAARAILNAARARDPSRRCHAFPSVDNIASNVVCERAGMTLLGPVDFEYPPGHPMRCNDWCR